MLLAEYCDNAIRYGLSRGIVTDESIVNYGSLEAQIIYTREALAIKKLTAGEMFEPIWSLTHYADYNFSIQDNPSEESVYVIPPTIQGNISMITQEAGKGTISIVSNEAEFYDSISCQIPSRVMAFYQNGITKISSPSMGTIRVVANFSDPREVSNWNQEFDNFPFPDGFAIVLYELLYKTAWSNIQNKAIDTKPDSADTLITPNQK